MPKFQYLLLDDGQIPEWLEGGGLEVAWRCLDAQYWGVPQRRKRIFLICDFGGQRAGEILFEPQGLFGDSQEGRKARKEVAASAGDGVKGTEYLTGWDNQEKRIFTDRGVAPTLAGSDGGGGRTGVGYVAQIIASTITAEEGQRSPRGDGSDNLIIAFNGRQDPVSGNVTGALDTDRATQCVVHPQITGTLCASGAGMSRPAGMASETDLLVTQCVTTGTGRRYDPESETLIVAGFKQGNSATAGSIGYEVEKSPTLTAGQSGTNLVPAAVIPILEAGTRTGKSTTDPRAGIGIGNNGDPMYTLQAGKQHAIAYDHKDLGRRPATFENVSPTLKARAGTGGNNLPVIQVGYAVRRLTPLECERLQGLPDGWTSIPGASDTARYKAIGNGLAIPCPDWILERMANVLQGLSVDMEVPNEP